MRRLLALTTTILVLTAAAAAAQTPALGIGTVGVPAEAGGGVINIGQALGPTLQPYVDALVQALLAALGGWVMWILKTRLGINIDEQNRKAIQEAVARQAASLVADGFVKIEQNGKITVPNNPQLVDAANKALAAVPDAMKYFGLDANPQDVAARIVDAMPHVPAVAQAQSAALAPEKAA